MDIAQTIKQRAAERGVDPELALAIARAESGLRPQIKNPKSSAHGLFQIIDDTWTQYGGDPKKRKDVNENIRIGLEILADNQQALATTLGRAPRPGELYAGHFFGKTGAQRVLSANPNAPISSVVSERVLKANPELLQGKSISQALAALGAKVGDTGPGQRAPAPKTTKQGYREDPANPPVISNAVDATRQYGAGYQAALALSYLSDTEEEVDDPEAPSVVEREARSEIEEQETVAAVPTGPRAADMLASMEFGYAPVVSQREPVKLADGGLLEQAASVRPISPTARKQYTEASDQWKTYSDQATGYNTALDVYNREVMTPYSAQVAAYNNAVDAWNAGPRTSPLGVSAPTPSRQFTMAAPAEPTNTLSPDQMNALLQDAQKRRAKASTALRVAADPSQFGLSMPAMFNEGGEVTDAPPARSKALEALYGAGETALTLGTGAAASLASMPYGLYKGLTSGQYLQGKAADIAGKEAAAFMERNTYQPRTESARENLAALGKAVEPLKLAPTPGGAAIASIPRTAALAQVERVGMAAEKSLEAPVKKILERGGKAADLLRSFETAPSRVVRAPGGNVPEQSLDFLTSAEMDRGLKKVPPERRDEIEEFIRTKGRKYFEKDFASTSDPLYDALKEGRIAPLASSNAMMRQYMLSAARSGDPEALQDLATTYDRGIKPRLVRPQGAYDSLPFNERTAKEAAAVEAMRERLEQSPGAKNLTEGEKNIPSQYAAYLDQEHFEKYYTGRSLTEGELRGVEKGSPFYTFDGLHQLPDFVRPDKLAQSFADIPSDRLSKMTYAEAAIEANRFARFREDYGSAVRRIQDGKDVPREVKLFGTVPVTKAKSGEWYQITDPAATEMEGAMMGHSVGGYSREGSYNHGGMNALLSGRAKVYTLRDNKGTARVTVEALDEPEGMMITQIKGKYNAGPLESEVPDVFKLLETLDAKKKIDRVSTESYLPKENAPPDALRGTTEWQRLYNEYLLSKE